MTRFSAVFSLLMTAVLLSASEIFEAEKVLKPGIEYTQNVVSDVKWDLWGRDANPASWSGGKTLRHHKAMTADCPPEKAPGGILEFQIPVEKAGRYSLRVAVATYRSLGFSVDGGKTWKKFNQPKVLLFQGRECKAGETITILAAHCFGTAKGAGSVYIDTFELFETPKTVKKANAAKVFTAVPTPADAGKNGRFEAEDVLVPGTELAFNTPGPKWDIWNRDANPGTWSGERTVRAGKIMQDYPPEKAPSGILKFRIPVRKDGIYRLSVRVERSVGLSVDGGKTWIDGGKQNLLIPKRELKAGDTVEVLAANCFFFRNNPGSAYLDCFELTELAPPKLLNPDFSGKVDPKTGVPDGWMLFFYDPVGGRISVGKGKVTIESAKAFIFTNRAIFSGVPGDIFEVKIPVKNLDKVYRRPLAQFVGIAANRIVNHSVNQTIYPLKPQESGIISLNCMIPLNGGFSDIQYRLVSDGKTEIGTPQFRLVGNARKLGEKVRFAFAKEGKLAWTAQNASLKLRAAGKLEVVGKPGVRWTLAAADLRHVLCGSGIHFAAKAVSTDGSPAKLRMRLPAICNGEQSRMAINDCSWQTLGSKEHVFRYDLAVPCAECDQLGIAFDGEGSVILSPIEVSEIPAPDPVKPVYRKVPMSGAPVPGLNLGRGLVVTRRKDGAHYASWRLTAQDDPEIAFDVYSIVDGKEKKLNAAPIRQTTDFVIHAAVESAKYVVRPTPPFQGAVGTAFVEAKNGHSYEFSDPRYYAYGIAPADLDGDGEFDYVAHGCINNIDPILYHKVANPAPIKVEAFHRDGRRLWTKDLGPNIEMGMWFCPVTAADLDGDGKAEVIIKGSSAEDGSFLEPAGANRNKVMSGPEYLIVLDGMTGKELARAPWPSREEYFKRGEAHNYFARNQLAIFRPDGKTNCVLALRGTYTYMQCEAWKFANGKLEKLWSFNNSYLPGEWQGQGSHNTRVADVDGDGRDEVLLGASVIDDDGSPMWTTGGGHPDYLFVCDITKKNPGLEVITIYEARRLKHGGFTCANGKDGRIIWELDKPHRHVHRGYCGDMDARYRGWETGGADSVNGGHDGPLNEYHWSPEGKLLGYNDTAPYAKYKPFIPHFAYWDGDLQREEIGSQMKDFRGGPCGGGINGTFIAQFDVEGDWREEVAVRARGGFRICFTPVPAMDRRVSLMYDDVYRNSVLANSSGYLFDPSLGYLPTDDAPNLNLTMLKAQPGTLEVTVSAPYRKTVAGKLKLIPPEGMTIEQPEYEFNLSAGEIKTVQTKVKRIVPKSELIRAEWHLSDGRILRGQVLNVQEQKKSSGVSMKFAPGSIVLEGENINIQRGGEVLIRSDKRGVHGKCFSHWDMPGHLIGWRFNCDKPGKYKVVLRHACANFSIRRFLCNGVTLGEADIVGTGGGGNTPDEWAFSTPQIGGRELCVTLKKGENSLEMVNVGNSLNIDFVELVPVK